jgi:nucleoid DNA-binding protein
MQVYKTDFIRRLAKKNRRSQIHYAEALDEIFAGVKETLSDGHTLHFPGFGSFVTHQKKEQKLKTVGTGKMVTIPAHRYVIFHVGKLLRKAVFKRGQQKRTRQRK